MFSLVVQLSAEGLGLQCITLQYMYCTAQLIPQIHCSYQLNKHYEHSLTETWIPSQHTPSAALKSCRKAKLGFHVKSLLKIS